VAAPLSLGPFFHCCIPGTSIVSSRASVFCGFFLQHCPCLVPNNCVPCAV
jgi:hypothetical protein